MIDALLENNIEWATGKVRADPRYFRTTSEPHAPEIFLDRMFWQPRFSE